MQTKNNKELKKSKIKPTPCETCEFYVYDEEYAEYVCNISLDMDDMADFLQEKTNHCNYYRFYDEYKSVQKQN